MRQMLHRSPSGISMWEKPMALPRVVTQIGGHFSDEVRLRGTLIALAAIPVSAVMWGLFTGRWTAESRRARKLKKGAQINALMRIPVPWVFILLYLAGLAIQRVDYVRTVQPKQTLVTDASGWSVGGFAKGAGMLAPAMATMLAGHRGL